MSPRKELAVEVLLGTAVYAAFPSLRPTRLTPHRAVLSIIAAVLTQAVLRVYVAPAFERAVQRRHDLEQRLGRDPTEQELFDDLRAR